jgi:hypothetical protein
MSYAEIVALAESIRGLLDDPDAGLTAMARVHWEGALAALEAVLGWRSSLVEDDPRLR